MSDRRRKAMPRGAGAACLLVPAAVLAAVLVARGAGPTGAGAAAGAAPQQAAAGATAPLAGFVVDATRTTLQFTVTRPGETVEGAAHRFSGTVRVDPDHPGPGATVVLRVEAASLETGNGLRDRKMRGTHLEAATYPEIVFESTAVAPDDAGGSAVPPAGSTRLILEGRLRLHGVERPLRVPAVIGYHQGLLTADGEVAFTLSEFAIPIPRFLWMVLDDKVTVRFHAVATRAE